MEKRPCQKFSVLPFGENAGRRRGKRNEKRGCAPFTPGEKACIMNPTVQVDTQETQEVAMERIVVITLRGKQLYEDMKPDAIELVTEGVMRWEGDVCTLTYLETEMTGLGSTKTIIQARGEEVTMMREGEVYSQMVFRQGKRHLSIYRTPYGEMTIGVHARHVMVDLDEDGGDVELDYDIEMDHALTGRNVFAIHVEPSRSGSLKQ